MSEELKPCPFCGSDALSIKPNIHTGLVRVQCEACWAVTATSVLSNNRKTAIAAWNRRAPMTAPTPAGEEGELSAARLREIHNFLLGEGPLDGRWFGDDPPVVNGRKQPYWWRSCLRAALLSSPRVEEVRRMREALETIQSAYEDQNLTHRDFRMLAGTAAIEAINGDENG